MSYVALLGSIFVVHVVAMLSPGPAFLIVTRTAIAHTRRAGVVTALGIATGAAAWASTVVIGLSIVFARVGWLYGGVRWLGGLYLLYLAVTFWRTADGKVIADLSWDIVGTENDWKMFQLGVLTNLTNPGAALFFGSVFAPLMTPDVPIWVKVAAVGMVVVNSACWHMFLALLFSTPHAQKTYYRLKQPIDRIAGAILGLFGLFLLL